MAFSVCPGGLATTRRRSPVAGRTNHAHPSQFRAHATAPRVESLSPMPTEPGRIFIFGLGYTCLGLASLLQRRGWEVAGTCRSEDKAEVLTRQGLACHRLNPDDDEGLLPQGVAALSRATHVLSAVPPVGDLDRDPVLQQHAAEIARLASPDRPPIRWLGYLSSTGVYGDHGGGVCTEDAGLLAPPGSRGAVRAAAEQQWLALGRNRGLPVHVFRLGGIYGPGRSALDAAARGGAPTVSQAARGTKAYTARIHVADICGALLASMAAPATPGTLGGRVYNVADDDPSPRGDAIAYARELLGPAAAPATAEAAPRMTVERESEEGRTAGVGAAQSDGGAKRVDSGRIKAELGVRLLFPDYKTGLAAIHGGDLRPFS